MYEKEVQLLQCTQEQINTINLLAPEFYI